MKQATKCRARRPQASKKTAVKYRPACRGAAAFFFSPLPCHKLFPMLQKRLLLIIMKEMRSRSVGLVVVVVLLAVVRVVIQHFS
jgi:hypothetical protein